MATPRPQSYEQFLGDMLRAYMAKKGINDLNTGSVISSFFETVALSLARSSGDVFQILRDLSVDRAVSDALRNIAKDEGLQDLPARVAAGEVTVTDSSFSKISTKVFSGANPPNVGSSVILVSDASNFPSAGSVYIGRGTPNIEGPIPYSSKAQVGTHWELTLNSPTTTTKFHNINESVILAQGGVRNIPAGTVVRAPAAGASPDVNFTVTQSSVILDGETQVVGVPVSAQEPGTIGNVPIGSIREFSAPPFFGATVSNPLPFKTGRDVETDDELRVRIKRTRLSRGLGTALAVKNAVIGATPSDENSTVVSSEIVTGSDGLTTLYIDDGTGYEAKTSGSGIEVLVDAAIGGESFFQLKTGGRQTSIAKAFLLSNIKAPFDVKGTDRLAINIGGTTTEHAFSDSDFISPGGATAYEIVASINANTEIGFVATTSDGGTRVSIFGKAEQNESINFEDVTFGRNAAELIGLPSNKVETLRLFKNKKPLTKDGLTATLRTSLQPEWSPSIADGDTLILSIDNTPFITYTFNNADFIADGSYTTVDSANSLESWASVFNNKLTGVSAAIVGERITLTSNLGESDRAAIQIDSSSSLVVKGMFTASVGLNETGQASDYSLSRNSAQIRLKTPLSPGDSLTAGTRDTEGRIESTRILGGTVAIAADAYFWLLIDDPSAKIISTGVVSNTGLYVSKPFSNILRYSSTSADAFSNTAIGDYVIVWSEEVSAQNRIEGRINAKTSTTIDIKITSTEYAAAIAEGPIAFQEGITILRTTKVPQKLKVASGTRSLSEIVDELNLQVTNCNFDVFDDEIIVAHTLTKTVTGAILVVTLDKNAKPLSLIAGDSDISNESLFGFYESGFREGGFPLFVHSSFVSDTFASPPDSFISSANTALTLSSTGLDPNFIVGYLQPYGAIPDLLQPSENTPLLNYSGSSITIEEDRLVKRLRTLDRWYAASPLDFGHDDEMIVVVDGDDSNKTFSIPIFRQAKTNTTSALTSISFNAYDFDGGDTASFSTYFGPAFKFDNYKALMQAKNVIDPSATEDAVLYRAVQWGRSGEKINVGYTYPTVANSDLSNYVEVNSEVKVRISLKSGAPIPNSIDGTTEWDVVVTPNTPTAGTDQVTYSWNGIGSSPGLGGLAGGEYVNITEGSQLNTANTGVFRVSTEIGFAPTLTSFTVAAKSGSAVAESAKATLVANVFSFYAAEPTTAADIVDYVTSNAPLQSFITATIADDLGLTGAGVISKSTAEESDFAFESVALKDGINWIATTNISGSPQFVLKNALNLPSATGYAFNAGEKIRLVPTNIGQLSEFLNVLAVTGYTTLGGISVSRRDSRLELSTKTLGGGGSVQVVGGQGNVTETPVLSSSSVYQNQYTLTSIGKSGIDGLHSDQWVRLQALNKQKKETSITTSTNIRIESDAPTAGQSTITLLNGDLASRHFGKPRHHIRTRNRAFKVEKQGDLTCISWDGSGTQPFFQKTANLNDTLGGTLNIERILGTSECNYKILTGSASFGEISIGDLVVIQNMTNSANDGTFLVTGVSFDGKILKVLNPSGENQFSTGSFTITNNADILGDEFNVDGQSLIAGTDFAVGATAADSAANLAATIPGVTSNATAVAVGATVIITAQSLSPVAIFYSALSGGIGAVASGTSLVGDSFFVGDFSCAIEITENDSVIIDSAFDALNQGTFRVVRTYGNSFYIENESSIEEFVTASYDPVGLGFDGTTQFDVDASQSSIKLSWNGIGTEPTLGEAKVGDELSFGTDFSIENRGTFMVTKSQPKLKEITKLTALSGDLISGAQSFYISAANDSTLYYVWFVVDGIGIDPAPPGRTGILVNIGSSDTAAQVASAIKLAVDAVVDFDAIAADQYVTITNATYGPCTATTNTSLPAAFGIETIQSGQQTYLEALNTAGVNESSIVISDLLECHRPPMRFYEYEASIPNDSAIIASDFLGANNQGTWKILEVLDRDRIVVNGTMTPLDPYSIAANNDNIFIEESTAFSGYKKIVLTSVDPANVSQRGLLVFDSRHQSNKINESAGMQISAIGKLNFGTTLRRGLDSYRYHTGLIAESNRIVYGEPRDTTTYPGVSAAGAEIFIREPLIKRIKVGIAVRLETGVPFSQISEQVRTNVTALINGNPIGTPIAISDIVSAVNVIPGVRAMAITSPLYNASNDTINIGPSEKGKVLDPISDVNTSQIT